MAACVIYKCLVQWHAFDSERTSIFDYIIEGINEVLKVIHPFQYLGHASFFLGLSNVYCRVFAELLEEIMVFVITVF